jgi:two-component system, cell cycle sensor histidine kinase and response regulator CckA
MNLDLLGALPDPSFLVDTTGRILGVNRAATDLLGVPPDTLEGQSILPLVSGPASAALDFLASCGRTRSTVPGAISWKLATGPPLDTRCDGALVLPAAGGKPATVYFRCRPKQDAIARFIALNEQIRALSLEIDRRRKLEAALRKSEDRYRTLVSATSSVVWTADASGVLSEPQPSWETYTGQTTDDARGLGFLNAVHPDDRDHVGDQWRESVATGRLFELELRLWHNASKAHRYCLARSTPVRDEAGRIREWVGSIADIEDRRKLDEQMRQTQKLESLGVLAGGVAHDFNNLLVGILGNASLAIETISSNNPARNMLRDVVAAAETAAHLTKQLLAYAGKGRFVIEPVDLSELIRQIQKLIQTSIPRTVQLRLDLQDRLPCVDADLGQLQQLMMNLIINGAEAIGEDKPGAVLVTTGVQNVDEGYIQTALAPSQIEPGTYVTVEVHDTGVGMTDEVIARIFDPFFTTKFTGRGLGLAAVLGIVRGHKGAIKVYSTPGHGTTFKVLFPASGHVSSASPAPDTPAAHTSAMVLVVDDEPVVRRTAKSMLERFGYSVVMAENGREGVELFRVLADKIAVVLLDMTMPVMSGEETFRELRAIRPGVRVVLSSGYNEVEAVRRFTGKGLAGFLQKPYSAAALAEKVRSVIEESSRHAAQGE